MNKLLAALIAGGFAFASVSAAAQDKTPPAPVDQGQLKAEAAAKKAADAKMTPEEKAAAKKAKRAKKQTEVGAIIAKGQPNPNLKAKEDAKAMAASKAGPAPAKGTLNTPEANKALQQQKAQ